MGSVDLDHVWSLLIERAMPAQAQYSAEPTMKGCTVLVSLNCHDLEVMVGRAVEVLDDPDCGYVRSQGQHYADEMMCGRDLQCNILFR